MQIDRPRVIRAFEAYVADYDPSDPKIALKAQHTLRVAELCEGIARSLQLPSDEEDLAWLLGMLHDIGRFEQVRRYGTFYDSQSVNHAEFGADLLFCDGLMARFAENPDPVIEIAIRNHNRLRVQEGLDERTQLFCDILRDADKIDILRVNVERPAEEIYGATLDEIMLTGISPQVEETFFSCRCVDRAVMRTLLDRRVGHFCFTFELVFPWSIQAMKDQGYLSQALSVPSPDAATEETLQRMRIFMDQWLQSALKEKA